MGFSEIIGKINDSISNFIQKVKDLPNDEKAAYGSIVTGFILTMVAVVIW